MKEFKMKLSLDRPTRYRIRVWGMMDESWVDLPVGTTVSASREDDDFPVSTLIATLDQAALLGLLRRLYAFGIPLISVVCVDREIVLHEHRGNVHEATD